MEQNLVGYVLNALDEEAHQDVEEYLDKNPAARDRTDLLKKPMAILALDADEPQPPADLAVRTLARVAEYACEKKTTAESATPPRTLAFPLAFLGRADVLVAACLLIAVTGVGLSWLYYLQQLHHREACMDSLAKLYLSGLDPYRQVNHHFPNVATVAKPPRNVSGMVVPMLISQGYLPSDFTISCPTGIATAPIKFDDALKMSLDKFQQKAGYFTPGLGYSLGYRDAGGTIFGPDGKPGDVNSTYIVLMADAPPKDSATANSPNHGGSGQNVLYGDGHAEFKTTRMAGFKGDDIYLNKYNKRQAGTDPRDSVIGDGWSNP